MKRVLAVVLLLGALLLPGCSSAGARSEAIARRSGFPVTVRDDSGRSVVVPAPPRRIVTLSPAATQIALGLGLGDRLVGVNGTRPAAEVRATAAKLATTVPTLAAVKALDPDLVLASRAQATLARKLESAGIPVVLLDASSVEGVCGSITTAGRATGTEREAAATVARIRSDVDGIRARVATARTVRCFVEVASRPLTAAGSGTLVDDLVAIANGRNVVGRRGVMRYPLRRVLRDAPQVYLSAGDVSNPTGITRRKGFAAIPAVREGRILLLDETLAAPGPQVTEALLRIAKALHPEAFGLATPAHRRGR